MISFYDWEVFKYDNLVVIIDPFAKTEHVFVNDPEGFGHYYEDHKNDIWIGYNNRHYDQYISKAVLAGFDAWDMNDWIINKHKAGWEFSSLLAKYPMINYDLMLLGKSLKQLEGFQGHNIHETGVPFNIDRKLTPAEIEETIGYCRNDVLESINIFLETKSDFDAQLGLIKMFKLPLSMMGKTKAQLSAEVLECERINHNDEWELSTLPCLRLDKKRWLTVKRKKKKSDSEDEADSPAKTIGKVYMSPAEWFLTKEYQDYRYFFECKVAGVLHQFGWGGLHGAIKKFHYKCKKGELLIHVDVASYYPSLMIMWNLLTRNSRNKKRYAEIKKLRLKLKHEGKKKEQAPLKIVLNGTFGLSKDPNNKGYDPLMANMICVNGQLLLLDLIEKMSAVESFQLIQSNTDGLIVKIHERDFEQLDDICYEWEQRCRVDLEFDYISEIWQKDVNNYVFKYWGKDKFERKGAYVKELSRIDNDLPIINKALVDYMTKGTPMQQTIRECDEMIMFQKVCKLTSNYKYVTDNTGAEYYNKCYRIFASTDESDGLIQKVKYEKGRLRKDKFANTSEHSRIVNGDITGSRCPDWLDKEWYCNLALKRLEQYGIDLQ